MAKLDKSLYSKEEVKRLMEERRKEKKNKPVEEITDTTGLTWDDLDPDQEEILNLDEETDKNYVLCLKHGTKYSADYVNKLYNMVQRNCTIDHEFVCLTDDPKGINPNVKILPLPGGMMGWWCKPYMFSKDLPIKGTILYIDLDVVISSNIDKLFTYHPERWCTVRDFTRAMRPKWQKYNSSVVRFKTGQLDHVWRDYDKDKVNIQRKFFGDQDWLYEATRSAQAMLYPDTWILSWKWEVRKSKEFKLGDRKGNRKFKNIEHVTPRVECCICVFHGDPNPHNCEDPWVVDNWK
jgi:hypothetical protein